MRARGRAALVALVAGYVVVVGGGLGALVWSGLTAAQQESLAAVARDQAAALLAGAAVVVAGLVGLLAYALGRYAAAARRLLADVRLTVAANPDHRAEPSGPAELSDLADAVNELAESRRVAEREVTRQVEAARAEVEQERNRLASLMAELAVAVLVCNAEGRILLYNEAARRLVGDESTVGLGRSVYDLLDRDLVDHALGRVRAGAPAHVATVLRGEQLLQVRLAPVREPGTGFVAVLDDETGRLQAGARRDALLRELAEGTRASLGSIRAAIENVLDYPDMAPQERRAFAEVVRDEAERLGDQVQRWHTESGVPAGESWLLTDIRGADLLTVLARELQLHGVAAGHAAEPGPDVWLKVDSHALARVAGLLASCLRADHAVERVSVTLTPSPGPGGHHAELDVRWAGPTPAPDTVRAWLDQPLTVSGATSVREVVDRHGGEAWCGRAADGDAYARLLLPRAEPGRPPARPADLEVGSRPELYDFDLFDLPEAPPAWRDRRLADLTYTVLDTETTGLDPATDEIVSVGAVRVVNGRVLRGEAFDRLVDPGRPVPPGSTAVHGITSEMVRGEPPIELVLPQLARYAGDTVLVGHNVGFDLRLLREKEGATGVRFRQPVLDTLLLDAALHPDHDEHTLEALARRLGVEVVGRHSALGDAVTTAEVFLRLVAVAADRGIATLGQALAASRSTLHARRDRALYER